MIGTGFFGFCSSPFIGNQPSIPIQSIEDEERLRQIYLTVL